MINSGDHLEWPPTQPEEIHRLERKIDTMLTELFDKEFDEAMWEWMLEQGPPQDDDIVWLKQHTAYVAMDAVEEYLGLGTYYHAKVNSHNITTAWAKRVTERLETL